MIALGIDPGQSGGLALVSQDTKGKLNLFWGYPMPLKFRTKKPTLNWAMVTELADEWNIDLGVIENVHAMPAQGVSSSFQFGRMFGAAEVITQHCADRQLYVTPQAWKKHFGLIKADKGASIALATELFGTANYWPLKKHDGVAEAALIAAYGLHLERADE